MQSFHLRLVPRKCKTYFLACVCFTTLYCIAASYRNLGLLTSTMDATCRREITFIRNGTMQEDVKCHRHYSNKCPNECKASTCYINKDTVPPWVGRNLIKHSGNRSYLAFDQKISAAEWREMVDLLDIFRHACLKASISYFLYGGSLIGAYRHFGFIQWDDDVDVMLNGSERGVIRDILMSIPGYSLHAPNNTMWKFYRLGDTPGNVTNTTTTTANRTTQIDHGSYRWPFMDIFFFNENSSHIWDDIPSNSRVYNFRKDDVFPLTLLPFEHLIVTVPRRTDVFLERGYNVSMCVSPHYKHRWERHTDRRTKVSLLCKRLVLYFPFVTLEQRGESTLRRLTFAKNHSFYELITDSIL